MLSQEDRMFDELLFVEVPPGLQINTDAWQTG